MKSLRRLLAALSLAAGLCAATASAQERRGGDAEALLRAAQAAYEKGNFEEAADQAERAARLSPEDHRPHALAGYARMALMEFAAASDALTHATRLRPDDKQLLVAKAQADEMLFKREDAMAAARRALALDPSYAPAHAVLGDALAGDEKRLAEAAASYRAAIRFDPKLLKPYERLGDVLAGASDEKGAEDAYRQGMAADPGKMTGRFSLGRLLIKQGRLAEARQLWEGRTTDEDDVLPNFKEALDRAERLKRATDALAERPNDPELLVAAGLATMEGESWVVDDRQERALVYFRKALAARPDYARAQYGIAKAYIQLAAASDDKKKLADRELDKLRALDKTLAAELDEYRKNYSAGVQTVPSQ